VPGLAAVVAVDGAAHGWGAVAGFSVGEPYGNHEAPVFELQPVAGSGGEDLPAWTLRNASKVRVISTGLERGDAVVLAFHIKTAGVIDAVQVSESRRFGDPQWRRGY